MSCFATWFAGEVANVAGEVANIGILGKETSHGGLATYLACFNTKSYICRVLMALNNNEWLNVA